MRLLFVVCLIGGGALSAPTPKAVLPIVDYPMDWKDEDFNGWLPRPEDPGQAFVIAWESITYKGNRPRFERCLLVKKYAKPGPNGQTFALGHVHREPDAENKWLHTHVHFPETKEWSNGVDEYKSAPSDDAIAAFLKKYKWASHLETGEYTVFRRRTGPQGERVRERIKFTPEKVEGGICIDAWRQAFGRGVPSADLFPELARRQ